MKARSKFRLCALLGALLMLVGCATPVPPLYMWETFPRQQYDRLLREGSVSDQQIQVLDAHAQKARATNASLPPGFRAHLGMLHLDGGNADRARELWQAEKAAFPESAPYIDQLLKRLDGTAKTVKKENPA
jgi:hypothetical protein